MLNTKGTYWYDENKHGLEADNQMGKTEDRFSQTISTAQSPTWYTGWSRVSNGSVPKKITLKASSEGWLSHKAVNKFLAA